MPDRTGAAWAASHETELGARPAADLAAAVREQAAFYAGKRKADVAALVSDAAEAIRASGTTFDSQPNVKAFFDQAAEGVDDFAAAISKRTLSEIYDEVEDAARRRPLIAGTVAAAAAFALVRFLRKPRPLPRSRTLVPVDAVRAPADL